MELEAALCDQLGFKFAWLVKCINNDYGIILVY